MLSLVPVSGTEIPELAAMADTIWHEYFHCILTREQIDYMVDRFQSEHAMREQVSEHGYQYFFITSDGERIGYTGIVPEGDRLFISKVYLKAEHRGKGLGTQAIKSIFRICEDKGYRSAYLTVNRGNRKAITAYERNGFKAIRTQVTDTGRGFVMDDYVMEKVF